MQMKQRAGTSVHPVRDGGDSGGGLVGIQKYIATVDVAVSSNLSSFSL